MLLVNCQNQQIAHEPNIATRGIICKTVPQGLRALWFSNSPGTGAAVNIAACIA